MLQHRVEQEAMKQEAYPFIEENFSVIQLIIAGIFNHFH